MYFSLTLSIKYDEACITILMVTTPPPFLIFWCTLIIFCYLFFSPYCDFSRWYLPDGVCGCSIFFLFYHLHIQNTWICSCLIGSGMFQYHVCFWSIGGWLCTDLLWVVKFLVTLSIVWFFFFALPFLLLILSPKNLY